MARLRYWQLIPRAWWRGNAYERYYREIIIFSDLCRNNFAFRTSLSMSWTLRKVVSSLPVSLSSITYEFGPSYISVFRFWTCLRTDLILSFNKTLINKQWHWTGSIFMRSCHLQILCVLQFGRENVFENLLIRVGRMYVITFTLSGRCMVCVLLYVNRWFR